MNKVESIIKEEIGQTIVNLAIKEIKLWATKELNYLRYSLNKPLIFPINEKNWLIGNFIIKAVDTYRFEVKKENKLIHIFYSKKAAVLYTIFEKTKNYTAANDILTKDKIAAKNYDEYIFYKSKLDGKSKIDPFKYQLWQARYQNSKFQLAAAQRDLTKTISNAKYMKIWDKLL